MEVGQPASWSAGLETFQELISFLLASLSCDKPPEGEPNLEKWRYVLDKIQTSVARCKIANLQSS
jgi:hypothetical protein